MVESYAGPRPKARLVVGDDAFMRAAMDAILGRDGSLEVVGEAKDGRAVTELLTFPRVVVSINSVPTSIRNGSFLRIIWILKLTL